MPMRRLVYITLIAIVFTSCSSEYSFLKRRYTKGYYHEVSKHAQITSKANESFATTSLPKQDENIGLDNVQDNFVLTNSEQENKAPKVASVEKPLNRTTTKRSDIIQTKRVSESELKSSNNLSKLITEKKQPYCSDPGSTGLQTVAYMLFGIVVSMIILGLLYAIVIGALIGLFSGAFLGTALVIFVILVALAAIIVFMNSD